MMTKKALTAIILITLFSQMNSWAQDLYYWSDGHKISLSEDHTAMMVQFKDGVDPTTQFSSKNAGELEEVIYHRDKSRAVLIFKKNQTASRSNIIQRFAAKSNNIVSTSFAYQLEGGFRFYPTSQVVLELKNGNRIEQISDLLDKYNAYYDRTSFGTIILKINDISQSLALANEIRESGLVTWSHPDFYGKIVHYDNPFKTLAIPNDPLFGAQFQMNNTGQTIDGFQGGNDFDCNAPEAWDITKGSSNITVAVIDDGVEGHEDLGNVLNGFTPLTNGNGSPNSSGNHGQACAGIIAALHNNLGVAGLAPNVDILPINIFAGQESTQDLADAISWAANNGADVISNSWGYPNTCTASAQNINSAISNAATNGRGGKGCVIVFASGNGYQSCVDYPAWLDDVIAVGAFGNDGVISDYSNEGTALDIVAPSNDVSAQGFLSGAGVRTIDRMGSPGYNSTNYTNTFGGTSAACPVVSGVSALVLSVDPNLTLTQVKDILYNSAIDMGSSGRDNTYGHGRVNAFAAVQAAGGNNGGGSDTQAPSTPSNLSASNATQTTVDLSWTGSTDNVGVSGYRIYVDNSSFTTSSSTSTTISGLSASTTYSIYVTAFDAAGNESSASNTVSVTTQAGNGGGGGNPTVLSSNSFETGLEDWNDGGGDCARVSTSTRSYDGNFSVRIRDNSGVASSMTSDAFDLSAYTSVDVEFFFYPLGMENGEDFWLRYNDGSGWQTVATYAAGSSFDNGSFYTATVTLNSADYNLTSNAQFRFQCDASVNNDRIYMDLITITGNPTASATTASTQSIFPVATTNKTTNASFEPESEEAVFLYPNPVRSSLNIENAESIRSVKITNLQGKVIKTFKGGSENLETLDLTGLRTGLYIIVIENGDEVEYKRFFKE